MSADRPDPEQFVDGGQDSEDGWHDPHDIVPEAFRERYQQAASVSDALAIAERGASDTDPEEFERCPSCLSVRLRSKAHGKTVPNRVDADKKCTSCGEHFDDALPSLVDARRLAAHAPSTDRENERPRCRACLSTALYPVPERVRGVDADWACLDCAAHFDDALPSFNATVRGEGSADERRRVGELLREVTRR